MKPNTTRLAAALAAAAVAALWLRTRARRRFTAAIGGGLPVRVAAPVNSHGELPDDGQGCASYGPNWEKGMYSSEGCQPKIHPPWADSTQLSDCCGPASALSTAHCSPDWKFGSPACDGTASTADYCGSVVSCPAPVGLQANSQWTYYKKCFNVSMNKTVYVPQGQYTGAARSCQAGGVRTANRLNVGDTNNSCIVHADQAAAACDSSGTCSGFGVSTNAGWRAGYGYDAAQLWFDPVKPGANMRTLVADDACKATALRSPGQPWVAGAAQNYCGQGTNMRDDPFCSQYCLVAGKPAWCDRAARAYCNSHPGDRDFCACQNTSVPSPTCLDGACTSRMGAGGAYTSAAQDRQSQDCGSPTVCQQVFDFQAVNCPRDPLLKTGACINISGNSFAQACTGSPPPCRSDANCAVGKLCQGGACVAPHKPAPGPGPAPPAPAPVGPGPAPAVPDPAGPPGPGGAPPADPAAVETAANRRKIVVASVMLAVSGAAIVGILAKRKAALRALRVAA